MNPAALRARLQGLPIAGAVALPVTNDDALDLLEQPLKAAAVLVLIVYGPSPGVLLTRRTTTLSSHAGQVAFPGGRIDLDETAEEAALREAYEEIGLDPALVDVIGRLPDHVTGSGYRITPVIGLLAPGFVPVPSPAEVDAVFELPLDVLLDPLAPRLHTARYKGRDREFWVWPHDDHYIWGATAAILVKLAELLHGDGPR